MKKVIALLTAVLMIGLVFYMTDDHVYVGRGSGANVEVENAEDLNTVINDVCLFADVLFSTDAEAGMEAAQNARYESATVMTTYSAKCEITMSNIDTRGKQGACVEVSGSENWYFIDHGMGLFADCRAMIKVKDLRGGGGSYIGFEEVESVQIDFDLYIHVDSKKMYIKFNQFDLNSALETGGVFGKWIDIGNSDRSVFDDVSTLGWTSGLTAAWTSAFEDSFMRIKDHLSIYHYYINTRLHDAFSKEGSVYKMTEDAFGEYITGAFATDVSDTVEELGQKMGNMGDFLDLKDVSGHFYVDLSKRDTVHIDTETKYDASVDIYNKDASFHPSQTHTMDCLVETAQSFQITNINNTVVEAPAEDAVKPLEYYLH